MKSVAYALLLACFLGSFTVSLAQGAALEILPTSENQTKPIGRSMLLTCKPNVTNKNLISQLHWTDPSGREVPLKSNALLKPHVYADWLPPPGDMMLVLMIPEVRESDSGEYTCSALYSNTERISKSVHVQTIMPITWDDAPKEQYPTVNESFKIHCKVSANPTAIVDWLRDGRVVETGGRYVVEQDGLTILNVTEMDDGTYTCRAIVIATGEMAHRPIRVEVHTPPRMTGSLPAKLEAVEGTEFAAKCEATGKPTPQYTWIRVDTARDLTKYGDRVSADINHGDLRIREVRPEDAANYSCTANNAAGTAAVTVELTVVVRPRIGHYDNISVASGKEAVLECHATGSPLPSITFRKLSNPKRYVHGIQPSEDRITVDAVNSPDGKTRIGKLLISNVLRSDDGLYECIAINKGGEVKKNGHLMVEFKPSFADTPQKEVWGWDRHAVNLTCLAQSIPNATISWRFNGQDLFRGRDGKPSQVTGYILFDSGPRSTLQVTPLSSSMYGSYRCTATNKHGTAGHDIMLREARAPSAVLQVKMDVMTATTATFKFFGPGNDGGLPTKNYAVRYKQDNQVWEDALNRTWTVDSSYILENLKPQTRYNFRFAAQNEVGFGPWSSQQTHTTPRRSAPEEPRLLGLPQATTNSVSQTEVVVSPYFNRYELRWQVPADNGEPITHYSIKSCPVEKHETEWRLMPISCQEYRLEGQATAYQLESLQPDTHYKVEVRATNAIGNSVPGQIIIRTVKDPSQMPELLDVETEEQQMSSAAIVVVVVAALLLALLLVDLVCCLVWQAGLIAALCHRCCSSAKTDDSDAKIASEEKEPLRDGKEPVPVIKESRVKRETAVDFDMKKSVSRTSFVGKDSAV